ncbi:MAG: flagellar assembly protein J [Candidatus Methanolliviera sp. GoM_oil]|nr:MAG: flagellar assembly protein J [Candidatus Methanolliviera sp. GoM_oil]
MEGDLKEEPKEERSFLPPALQGLYNGVRDGIKRSTIRIKEWYEGIFAGNDLLYMLTYMASISTAKISRDEIFKRTGKKEEFISSKYIDTIRKLVQEWHYDYSAACNAVADKVKDNRTTDMLDRMGNAIKSGEPDEEFLMGELKTTQTITKNRYEMDLETLRKANDAFTALLISASVVSIIVLLSVAIYGSSEVGKMLYLSAFVVGITSAFSIFLLFSASPKEFKTHPLPNRSKEQKMIDYWQRICIPLAIILPLLIVIFVSSSEAFPFFKEALAFISFGIILLPLGLIGRRDDKNIDKRDLEYPGFIKGLGSIMSASGMTIQNAMEKVDRETLPSLRGMINTLQKRLKTGLNPDICWNRFVGESGSNLIYKFTGIFTDSIKLGGEAEHVGNLASSSSLESVLLRMKRDVESSQFTTLVLPLHVSMLAILLCVSQVLVIFSNLLGGMMANFGAAEGALSDIPGIGSLGFGMFTGVSTGHMHSYVLIITIIITIASIVACKIVKGGGYYSYFYYGSIFSILSGVILISVPFLIGLILNVAQFQIPVGTVPTNIPGGGF